jgi:trans-aconitate methyltransferase
VKPAAPPAFYEQVLDDPRNSQWAALEANPYRPLYERTAALVPAGTAVVEIGCGTGRLAPLLITRASSYVGLDFAPRLIAEARRYTPGASFLVADIRSDPLPAGDTYVANEVLEHLDDDLGLLELIPAGATVVFSVPSFDSASHVRHFPVRGQARRRYERVLRIDRVEYVPHGRRGRFFHLVRGTR